MRFVAALLLGLVACGDNTRALTYDEYLAQRKDAICTHYVRCGWFTSRDECARPNAILDRQNQFTADAVTRGTLGWDPEVAANCLDDYADLTCDWTSEEARTFTCAVFFPTLHDSQACILDEECIGGECFNECGDACCVGYCVGDTPPIAPVNGESCRLRPCSEGWCDSSESCQPYVALGDSCVEGLAQCAPGNACAGNRCVVPALHLAHCDGACREIGDVCDSQTSTCRLIGQSGDSCLEDRECSTGLTCAGTECRYVNAPLGEKCTNASQCATPGALCIEETTNNLTFTRCVLPRPLGDTCRIWTDCESQNCDYTAGTCIEQCSLDETE